MAFTLDNLPFCGLHCQVSWRITAIAWILYRSQLLYKQYETMLMELLEPRLVRMTDQALSRTGMHGYSPGALRKLVSVLLLLTQSFVLSVAYPGAAKSEDLPTRALFRNLTCLAILLSGNGAATRREKRSVFVHQPHLLGCIC